VRAPLQLSFLVGEKAQLSLRLEGANLQLECSREECQRVRRQSVPSRNLDNVFFAPNLSLLVSSDSKRFLVDFVPVFSQCACDTGEAGEKPFGKGVDQIGRRFLDDLTVSRRDVKAEEIFYSC
jgi:hypothetical protein